MGASDYMSVNAPQGASYASPLIGFALGKSLEDLPNSYTSGVQSGRKLAALNAFPNGLPLDQNGQPDVNAIINKGVQIGGLDYAQPLMQLLLQQKIGAQQGANLSAIDNSINAPPGAQTGAASSPQAAGPANLRAPAQNAPRPPQPQLSSAGTDNQGADTVRSVATEAFGGRDVSGMIPRYAQALGVDPDAPLSPEQVTRARILMSRTVQNLQRGPNEVATDQTGGGAPVTPVSGVSGAPGPMATPPGAENAPQPPVQVSQAAQAASAPPQPAPPAGAGGAVSGALVPPGADPRAYADRLRQGAARARAAAASIAPFNAATAQQYEKQADAYDGRAKLIDDAISGERMPTPEQKNAKASGEASPLTFETDKARAQAQAKNTELTPEQKNAGVGAGINPQGGAASNPVLNFEQQKEVNKTDVEAGQKKYDAIQHQADEAHQLVQTLQLNQSLMDDPNFYSGVGEEYNLLWKRMKASMGLDPNEAMPQEAFRKTVSSAILDQIRSLGGQGLGQVRVAEINVMKQAAQNQDNTPAANRLLSEIQMRMANKWTMPIAELAQAYKDGGHVTIDGKDQVFSKHGFLDAGFDKLKTQYLNSHPLFSPEELQDTRRIAPPLARTPADLQKIGWHDGMPFRTPPAPGFPNGRILTHLAPQAATPQAQ